MNSQIFNIKFISLSEQTGSYGYHVGVLQLIAYLKANGYASISYDNYFIRSDDGPKTQILLKDQERDVIQKDKHIPNVLFVGPIYTMHLPVLRVLLEFIAEKYPSVPIFLGGYHFDKSEILLSRFFEHFSVSGIILRRAESAILEICDTLALNLSVDSLVSPNIVLPCTNLDHLHTRMVKQKDVSFNSIPSPDYSYISDLGSNVNFSLAKRKNPKVKGNKRVFETYSGNIHYGLIISSRGCPYSCRFCYGANTFREVRSAEHVFQDMKTIYEQYGCRLFLFTDPDFIMNTPTDIARISKLCDLVLQYPKPFKMIVEIRCEIINKLPSELLDKIIRTGVSVVNLGLEKGCPERLKWIMKGSLLKDQEDAIKALRNASKRVGLPIIINGTFVLGGQGESLKQTIKTVLRSFQLDIDGAKYFPLEIYPGTKVYEDALTNNIIGTTLDPFLKPPQPLIYASSKMHRKWLIGLAKLVNKVLEIRQNHRLMKISLEEFEKSPHELVKPIIHVISENHQSLQNNSLESSLKIGGHQ